MKINPIGLWTMRCLIVVGVIALACLGKADEAGWLALLLIVSFFVLDPED